MCPLVLVCIYIYRVSTQGSIPLSIFADAFTSNRCDQNVFLFCFDGSNVLTQ